MNERLDAIVSEVLKRLKLYLEEKRVLLILRDDSDFQEVISLIDMLKEKGYTFHLLSLLVKDIKVLERKEFRSILRIRSSIFKEEEYEHFMKSYESILISDLKLLEVQAYHELYFSETLGKLVFHTIRENEPVYGLSKELTGIRNDYLSLKMDEIKSELNQLKIHILTEKLSGHIASSRDSHIEGRKRDSEEETELKELKEQKEKENNSSRETSKNKKSGNHTENRENEGTDIVLRQKFITLSDIMSIQGLKEKSTLKIGSQSRLTMEASDKLGRMNVRLLRIEE